MARKRSDYFNKRQLKERGWTDRTIRQYINIAPVEFRSAYRCHPSQCYPKDYIIGIEGSEEWQAAMLESLGHKLSGKKAAETRRAQTMSWIADAVGGLQVERDDNVMQLAIEAKNWRNDEIGNYMADDAERAPRAVKRRWCVNYIRHDLSNYDDVLADMVGKVGRVEAYRVLFEAVMDRIAVVYPEYADECARQKAEKLAIDNSEGANGNSAEQ